jgi:hypothetical protein
MQVFLERVDRRMIVRAQSRIFSLEWVAGFPVDAQIVS